VTGERVESRVLLEVWRRGAEALFPARCLGCQRRGVALCDAYRHELPYLPAGVCTRCALPRIGTGTCRGCARLSPVVSAIRAAFTYEGAARAAILALKFRAGRHLTPLMGELLRTELRRLPLQVDVVVPVPLAPRRLKMRGYNQALLLAEQIVPATRGAQVVNALARGERRAQSTLDSEARLRNLNGAFVCARPADVAGRRVLLVDDVVTTGATASACADTLAEAGAGRITVLAFARDL
jgi:ComF family protein